MSIEEKLEKCVEFIRRVERGDFSVCVDAGDPRVAGDF